MNYTIYPNWTKFSVWEIGERVDICRLTAKLRFAEPLRTMCVGLQKCTYVYICSQEPRLLWRQNLPSDSMLFAVHASQRGVVSLDTTFYGLCWRVTELTWHRGILCPLIFLGSRSTSETVAKLQSFTDAFCLPDGVWKVCHSALWPGCGTVKKNSRKVDWTFFPPNLFLFLIKPFSGWILQICSDRLI